jgi:2-dehydro-3-deoxyphosphooctonate aldolase (KDO 8-P synthase)
MARLTVIAGPCVIESGESRINDCAGMCVSSEGSWYSTLFLNHRSIKANRSSIKSFSWFGNGGGDSKFCNALKTEVGVPVLTDLHDVSQVESVAKVVDVLQIPAFLCRRNGSDSGVSEVGKRRSTLRRGQFLAPHHARNIVEKAREAGCEKLLLTERGATFGYNNLVVDMRSFPIMRGFGVPVVFGHVTRRIATSRWSRRCNGWPIRIHRIPRSRRALRVAWTRFLWRSTSVPNGRSLMDPTLYHSNAWKALL